MEMKLESNSVITLAGGRTIAVQMEALTYTHVYQIIHTRDDATIAMTLELNAKVRKCYLYVVLSSKPDSDRKY